MTTLTRLGAEELEQIEQGEAAVVFKHSTRCSISSFALQEVQGFQAEHPEMPVYRLDVIENRSLSDRIADYWSVRHETPQVLVVKGSQLIWSGSHFEVDQNNLRNESRLLLATSG